MQTARQLFPNVLSYPLSPVETIDAQCMLKRSDLVEDVDLFVRRNAKFVKKLEIAGEARYVRRFFRRIREPPVRTILTAEPVKIHISNFKVNRAYKRIVVLQNVSGVIARYQVARRFDATLRVVTGTRGGNRVDLAPGMSATLTLVFRSVTPEDYSGEVVVNVERGYPVVLTVTAHRDPPVLMGENGETTSPERVVNIADNLRASPAPPPSSRGGSLTFATEEGELECSECLVGGEKTVATRVTNFGSGGCFFLLSEGDWFSRSVTSVAEDNQIVTDAFTIRPAYFRIGAGQTITLETIFEPQVEGLHVTRIYVLCDNLAVQPVEVLGDALLFDWNFLRFGADLRRETVSTEAEDKFCNFFVVELNPETWDVEVAVTNLSQFSLKFRWVVVNEHCLSVRPQVGSFPGHTTQIFTITGSRDFWCDLEQNLQLKIQDLPLASIPEDFFDLVENVKEAQRLVDVCLANVGVWLPSAAITEGEAEED